MRDATGTLLASLERAAPESRIVCVAWSKLIEATEHSNKLTAERLGMSLGMAPGTALGMN
jgi:hypothetical protein